MCGEWHDDPTIPNKCIHIEEFINEGLVVRQYNGRITTPDGLQLPRVTYGQKGGVAAILRARRNSSGKDAPPHLPSSSPAALTLGGVSVFDDGIFGVASADVRFDYDDPADNDRDLYDMTDFIPSVAPTTRSGKDTSARHDPMTQRGRTNNKRSGPRPPSDDQPSGFSPPSLQKPTEPAPPHAPKAPEPSLEPIPIDHDEVPPRPPTKYSKKSVSIPEPPNPINRNEGWHQAQPSRNPKPQNPNKPDVEMKDGSRQVPSSVPHYHFTSDLQQRTDSKKIFDKIIDTDITLSVGDLIGSSPSLMKLMVDAAKTRREYAQKSVSAIFRDDEDGEDIGPQAISRGLHVPFEDAPKLKDFLVKYSSAVVASNKLYAMVTGIFEVVIAGHRFQAMIDTGSELTIWVQDFLRESAITVGNRRDEMVPERCERRD
ncbi:hypothetical protein BT96DRAFT_994679 [Gymnopus androsaceus JB14]|uniref:DUF4100 domain-containing protein n=1 Tax=Gymnopus androsaceus JB14 TaxID=1447944 RepID=A0A6A4HJA8_9AGAR|nr:hypothetical protein BT96DRAFT_994679 [Gymnopus androsaceus JB14]